MGIVRLMTVAALAVIVGAGASLGAGGGPDLDPGVITREWIWSTGTSTTTFTATGPADQVNAFDPHDSVVTCEDCMLASSIQPVPVKDAIPIEVAEKLDRKH